MASALGSSSFPTMSTSFNAGDSAMMPMISENANSIQKMSVSNTMKEVFFDIRDGINDLSTKLLSAMSLQSSMLLSGFTMLNNTMSTIGSIAADDLDIENKSFDQLKDDQSRTDRQRSLGNQGDDPEEKGPGFFDMMSDRFNGLIDALTPKSEGVKVGLLGMLALGLAAFGPKLDLLFRDIFVFFDEKFIPFLKDLKPKLDNLFDKFKAMDFDWKDYLGMALGAYLAVKLGKLLILRAFLVPGGLKVLGYVGLAVWAISTVFKKAGEIAAAKDWTKEMGASDSVKINQIAALLAGNLEGGIKNAFSNASSFAIAGVAVGAFGGPVGMLIGGVVGAVIGGILGWIGAAKIASTVDKTIDDMTELWNESGVVGFLDLAMKGFYDNIIAKLAQIVTFAAGGILKLIGLDSAGQYLQDLRYSYDGLKGAMSFNTDIPDTYQDYLSNKVLEQKVTNLNTLKKDKLENPEQYIEGGPMRTTFKEAELSVIAAGGKVEDLTPAISKQEFIKIRDSQDDRPSIPDGPLDVKELILKQEKENKIALAKEKFVATGAGIPVIIPVNNSTSSNTTSYSNSSYTGSPRVDGMEPASAALLDYFRR